MAAHLRVAVLDDEKHVRESTGILLSRCCQQAEVVLSADPSMLSMETIAGVHPDLVLIDLTYNSQQDWSPTDLHEFLQVPVVVVTAHDPDTMHQLYPDLPFILKPISSEALKMLIGKVQANEKITRIEPT